MIFYIWFLPPSCSFTTVTLCGFYDLRNKCHHIFFQSVHNWCMFELMFLAIWEFCHETPIESLVRTISFSWVGLRTGIVIQKLNFIFLFREITILKMWPQCFTFLPVLYEVLVCQHLCRHLVSLSVACVFSSLLLEIKLRSPLSKYSLWATPRF